MKRSSSTHPSKRLSLDEKIKKAAALMTKALHRKYAEAGRKMPVWKNGRVVYVAP